MKKLIVTSATLLFVGLTLIAVSFIGSAKPTVKPLSNDVAEKRYPEFRVTGRDLSSVKQETLRDAEFISDFVPGYPVNWTTSHASVDILATSDGKTLKAGSFNDVLSAEQKNILNTVDLGTTIVVEAQYERKDGWRIHKYIGSCEDNRMYFSMVVVPETEAEYVGGVEEMKEYLKENAIRKIIATEFRQTIQAVVRFTVNEEGEIVDTEIAKTSGDPLTDQVLIDGINAMPKWNPAENSNGVKVKQEFEFSIGNRGC